MVIEKCCKTQTKSNKRGLFLENLEIDSDMAASFFFEKILGGAKGGRNFMNFFFHILHSFMCILTNFHAFCY